ncbi:MAG: response regulator transcription factor [Planctomycetes bacterium]|nr:response regulator transcription factor [Planctomycetota bacterium]
MAKILLIEDEPAIVMGVKDNLEYEGHEVLTAEDGERGLALVRERQPDLVLLDIMLPGGNNGFALCKTLRGEGFAGGIIMLTARREEVDKVRGLNLGADDYVTKPFSVVELLARVSAVLRRGGRTVEPLARYRFGAVELDFLNYQATKGGEPLALTPREFKILKLFVENRGRVISRNELLDKIWGYTIFPTTRTVDNHIVRIRKQIEANPSTPQYIVSVRGVGYKFTG